MKAILISIRPQHALNILHGKKTIEVRTSKALANAIQKLIDKYGYAQICVYCTKDKPNLWLPCQDDCFDCDCFELKVNQPYLSDKPIIFTDTKMNGKVIFKFRCYKVEEITPQFTKDNKGVSYITETKSYIELCNESRLLSYELNHYLLSKNGYAICITNPDIFDEPKEISEFTPYCELRGSTTCHICSYAQKDSKLRFIRCSKVKPLTCAPRSWCYVEV